MNDYLPKPFTPDDLYRKIFRELKIKKKKNGTSRKEVEKKAGFDLAYLRSISDNNQEFLREMIQTFLQTIPPVLEEMRDCLAENNWPKLSRLAHQVKPSFSLMGIDSLRKSVFYIEENAQQKKDLVDLKRITEGFIQDCGKVMRDLEKETIS
jgi:HPt (histidine-containing phosphotransfer) domain-containing protein